MTIWLVFVTSHAHNFPQMQLYPCVLRKSIQVDCGSDQSSPSGQLSRHLQRPQSLPVGDTRGTRYILQNMISAAVLFGHVWTSIENFHYLRLGVAALILWILNPHACGEELPASEL